jgi:hypothetical protein
MDVEKKTAALTCDPDCDCGLEFETKSEIFPGGDHPAEEVEIVYRHGDAENGTGNKSYDDMEASETDGVAESENDEQEENVNENTIVDNSSGTENDHEEVSHDVHGAG